MKRLFILTILSLLLHIASFAQIETPERWESLLCYADISHVEPAGDKVYVLASGNLFSYNKNDHSIQEHNRLNGLNSANITHIAWVNAQKTLMIFYADQLIDLISKNGDVSFIAGLKDFSTTDDKTIEKVSINGDFAYVTTKSAGTLKIDVKNGYILETIDEADIKSGKVKIPEDERSKMSVEEYNSLSGYAMPNALKYNKHFYLKFHNGVLYSLPGHNDYNMNGNTPLTIQKLKDGEWSILDQSLLKQYSYKVAENANNMDIDPRNPNHIMVTSNTGLYEYLNDQLVAFYETSGKYDASGHNEGFMSLTSNEVTSVKYDNSGNLYIFDRYSPHLIMLTKDNECKMFDGPKDFIINRYICPTIDKNGLIWFANQHYYQFCIGFFAPKEEKWCIINSFYNKDSKKMSAEYGYGSHLSVDAENTIWMGSNGFLAYIDNEDYSDLLRDITKANDLRFVQPKVNRNDGSNLADYLLKDLTINDMKFDKAGRMWVATQGNGVYLINPGTYSEVLHFTKENTPMSSDDVFSIALDESTGKVYIGTEQGLYTYISDVKETYGDYSDESVYAYPNPVTSDYRGAISITGLTDGCTVTITTAAGRLVHKGTCHGATYSGWYGTDASGRRVASGVYYVLVSDKEGNSACVTKIAIVN